MRGGYCSAATRLITMRNSSLPMPNRAPNLNLDSRKNCPIQCLQITSLNGKIADIQGDPQVRSYRCVLVKRQTT